MKFEQLIQIYWSRGFLYNGNIKPFDTTIKNLFFDLPGLSDASKNIFIRRFEFFYFNNNNKSFIILPSNQKKIINIYFSQLNNINKEISELLRFNLIRLYLIKTRRGRSQALGKPSRGQRTWSNAWNAYRCNRILRAFISEVKKNNVIVKDPVILDYRNPKRKIKKVQPKIKMLIVKKKLNLWF